MTLVLVKRSDVAGPLTQSQHDTNFDAIMAEVNAKQDKLDPVETTETAITIDDTRANKNLVSTAASVVTVTLGNSTSDNAFGTITEGAQEVTVVVTGPVKYYLKRDNLVGAGRTASFKVRGVIYWEVFRLSGSTDRHYRIVGDTDHDQDLRGQVITGVQMPLLDTAIAGAGIRDSLLTDAHQRMLRFTSGSASEYRVLPDTSVNFPIGTMLQLIRAGAGTLTITPGAGVAINRPADRALTARATNSVLSLWKLTTNTWYCFGDLT